MKYATFVNFTDEPFTAYWNGRPYTFKPGQRKEHLNESIAAHFAKHLANQVLTAAGKEQYTSPKKPEEVPFFMKEFNKAFFLEGHGEEVDAETGLAADDNSSPNEPSMDIKTKPKEPIDPYDASQNAASAAPEGPPQVIGENISDDESTFEGAEGNAGNSPEGESAENKGK